MDDPLQYLFNKSYFHIVKQGKPSVKQVPGAIDLCVYKSEEGCGCAASPFIETYYPEMETLTFAQLTHRFTICLDPIAVDNLSLVMELQWAHDKAAHQSKETFVPSYKARMVQLALKWGLSIPNGT